MSSFNVGSAHDGVNRRLGSKVRPKAPSVFINCPFDRSYYKMRDAIVFAVILIRRRSERTSLPPPADRRDEFC